MEVREFKLAWYVMTTAIDKGKQKEDGEPPKSHR